MDYLPPSGATDPNAPFIGKDAAAGTQGSKVPRGAIENPMRELVALIRAAGLGPTNGDLTQVLQAVKLLAKQAAPDVAMLHYGTDVSTTANQIVLSTITPTFQTLLAGMVFVFTPAQTNDGTSAPTVKIPGNDPILLRRGNSGAPLAGDLVQGIPVTAYYDGAVLRIVGMVASDIPSIKATYWRLDSPTISIPANTVTIVGNYANLSATVGAGTIIDKASGRITIGPNDGGAYILSACNAMDAPTTEESAYIFLNGSAISTSRGVYPSPGSDAMDKSVVGIERLNPGDVVDFRYYQTNTGNAALNSLNQSLGRFGGARFGG